MLHPVQMIPHASKAAHLQIGVDGRVGLLLEHASHDGSLTVRHDALYRASLLFELQGGMCVVASIYLRN